MIDIEQVLDVLGVDFTVRNNEANALCPMHQERTGKQDHNPSWWINLDSGQHICFSCGYKGGLLGLICDTQGLYVKMWGSEEVSHDYTSAKAWLSQVTDLNPEQLQIKLAQTPRHLHAAPKPVHMSEARLALFTDPPLEALQSRNITLEASREYGVMWDPKTSRWILPLRDAQHGTLVGWQEKGYKDRYFRNRPAGVQKSKTLFGIQNQTEDVVIVVESPLDCVRIASAGIKGAVATCGALISEAQIKLLRASSRVILALDNPKIDDAGRKASAEFRKAATKYGINAFYFNYGDSGKKDPGDMTDEEIRWGLENAKSSVYGEAAYV